MKGYLHIITAVIHSLCKGSHNILRGIMCHKFDNFIEQIGSYLKDTIQIQEGYDHGRIVWRL